MGDNMRVIVRDTKGQNHIYSNIFAAHAREQDANFLRVRLGGLSSDPPNEFAEKAYAAIMADVNAGLYSIGDAIWVQDRAPRCSKILRKNSSSPWGLIDHSNCDF